MLSFEGLFSKCNSLKATRILREMFKVNYLQGKHNKRSPAPLMPSFVLKSGVKNCFGGVIFQYAVIMLYLSNDAFQSYYDLFQVN